MTTLTTMTVRDAVFAELVLAGMPATRVPSGAGCGATPTEAREAEDLGVPVIGVTFT